MKKAQAGAFIKCGFGEKAPAHQPRHNNLLQQLSDPLLLLGFTATRHPLQHLLQRRVPIQTLHKLSFCCKCSSKLKKMPSCRYLKPLA